ncbi:MAG TPA: DnaJ domain-containing protein [Terracidiphilus sp.]|nr:DnaJ domain-containing protein [Terracidiphilus sp.]
MQALGLQVGATDSQIRSAYHVLVKVWHPDRFQQDDALKAQAEEKLKGVNAAFRYLTSAAARREEAERREQRRPPEESSGSAATADPVAPGAYPRVESFTRVALMKALSLPRFVWRFALVGVLALIGWVLFMPIDRALSSEPLTAGPYRQYKSQVWQGLVGVGVTISDTAGRFLHGAAPRDSLPTASAAQQQKMEPQQPAPQQAAVKRPLYPIETGVAGALPYVTAGLTEAEVIAVQGEPTSATDSQMNYGHSELYFSNDKLVGWKIDPDSPIRIKLWPDVPVDPDRDTFWVGSSKSEVIAVQGTPTLWSDDTFGYGRSEVYFRNGRVVNWKNDPDTIPLRAAER